jgi:hypothetical protein
MSPFHFFIFTRHSLVAISFCTENWTGPICLVNYKQAPESLSIKMITCRPYRLDVGSVLAMVRYVLIPFLCNSNATLTQVSVRNDYSAKEIAVMLLRLQKILEMLIYQPSFNFQHKLTIHVLFPENVSYTNRKSAKYHY